MMDLQARSPVLTAQWTSILPPQAARISAVYSSSCVIAIRSTTERYCHEYCPQAYPGVSLRLKAPQ